MKFKLWTFSNKIETRCDIGLNELAVKLLNLILSGNIHLLYDNCRGIIVPTGKLWGDHSKEEWRTWVIQQRLMMTKVISLPIHRWNPPLNKTSQIISLHIHEFKSLIRPEKHWLIGGGDQYMNFDNHVRRNYVEAS